jgi:hypothetical protein
LQAHRVRECFGESRLLKKALHALDRIATTQILIDELLLRFRDFSFERRVGKDERIARRRFISSAVCQVFGAHGSWTGRTESIEWA